MSSPLFILEVASPLVALLLLVAIAWVRRQNRRTRRHTLNMQRQLEIDLDGLHHKGQSIRQRIVLVADVLCRGEADGRDKLTRGIDRLLADVERLRWDLRIVASRWRHSHRGDIRETYGRLRSMVIECQELGQDLDERDGLWREQLSDMPSLSKAAHEMTGTRKQALT